MVAKPVHPIARTSQTTWMSFLTAGPLAGQLRAPIRDARRTNPSTPIARSIMIDAIARSPRLLAAKIGCLEHVAADLPRDNQVDRIAQEAELDRVAEAERQPLRSDDDIPADERRRQTRQAKHVRERQVAKIGPVPEHLPERAAVRPEDVTEQAHSRWPRGSCEWGGFSSTDSVGSSRVESSSRPRVPNCMGLLGWLSQGGRIRSSVGDDRMGCFDPAFPAIVASRRGDVQPTFGETSIR